MQFRDTPAINPQRPRNVELMAAAARVAHSKRVQRIRSLPKIGARNWNKSADFFANLPPTLRDCNFRARRARVLAEIAKRRGKLGRLRGEKSESGREGRRWRDTEGIMGFVSTRQTLRSSKRGLSCSQINSSRRTGC